MYGDRSGLEWLLLAAVLILLYLLLASLSGWWPWAGSNTLRLGTAFDSNNSVESDEDSSSDSDDSDGGNGSGNGSTDDDDSSSDDDGDDSGDDGSVSTSRLVQFAVTLDRGDSKEEVEGEVGDLEENCAVVLNASDLGKQEVCVYTEGEKVVTVTYLDDEVISASRSGF